MAFSSNKRLDHAGLLAQAQEHPTPGANILADIKAIAEKSPEGRKKTRPSSHGVREHYSVSWDKCQTQNSLSTVEAAMIDIFNTRANVRTLPKWSRPRYLAQRRSIENICDYWIGRWHRDPLISVLPDSSRQLWVLYNL
ncbi:hypothetical protein N7463_001583 [Penicillium fimorum]|uniref:Uncharacterized protein n=1 Tax=Penicillium fimorum TaxID=1882269 RepID=A0A9W9Y6I1_9EURO|nr:hypothetical protein N7463_001583 [Penicillium fimorum]